ncbi:High mobility group protein B2, partial [Eschrichtius robustus]|nr:High mobility group protein B2 [Eschrichtius robustus]
MFRAKEDEGRWRPFRSTKVNTLAYPPGILQKILGELWSEQSAKDKQSHEQKAAKLKEKYEKDIAAHRAKEKNEVGKKGPGRPTGSKKNEPEDEEEEDEDEE